MNIKITPDKESLIFSNLNFSNKKIANMVGVCEHTIETFLRKKGIIKGRRTLSVDESFFETIDSPSKAYILGLIYADGWNNIAGNRWGIQLTCSDEHILNSISKEINYSGTIKKLKPSCPNGKERSRLEVCSKKMCSDLLKLGVPQNKSLILDFNKKNIADPFLKDFFRGVFDGDGTIYIGKKNQFEVKITSSTIFCLKAQSFFQDIFDYVPKIRIYKTNEKSADLKFKGRIKCKLFLDWIYQGDPILKLNRKFEKFKTIKEI
jgi:hypothetical protein